MKDSKVSLEAEGPFIYKLLFFSGDSLSSSDMRCSLHIRMHRNSILRFDIDASVPCCVQLYWGLSATACNDLAHRGQLDFLTAPRGSRPATNGGGFSNSLRQLRGRWTGGRSYANPETTRVLDQVLFGGLFSIVGCLMFLLCRGGVRAADQKAAKRCLADTPSSATGVQKRLMCATGSLLEMEELNLTACQAEPCAEPQSEDRIFSTRDFVAQSRDFFLPAGCGQRYVTPAGDLIHPDRMAEFDFLASWLRAGQARSLGVQKGSQ